MPPGFVTRSLASIAIQNTAPVVRVNRVILPVPSVAQVVMAAGADPAREKEAPMKRILIGAALLPIAVALGYASMRFGRTEPAPSFPPHTIVYRVTSYDEQGKVSGTTMMVRRVFADGKWNHIQIMPDGKVLTPNGQMKGRITDRTVDAAMPQHLNYRYHADQNSDTWVSPELQDFLKFTDVRSDGSKVSSIEAISVMVP